jgi:hypothetical protein
MITLAINVEKGKEINGLHPSKQEKMTLLLPTNESDHLIRFYLQNTPIS